MGVLQRMMMKMMEMMKTNVSMVLLPAGDATPFEHGLACAFEAPQSGDFPENRFGVFLECSSWV